MTVPADAWAFDTGPLRHFSTEGWLGVLRFLADGRPVYIPDSVERELLDAGQDSAPVRAVLDADWILRHRSTDLAYVGAFAHYADRLVVGAKNRGECGVLAMGEVYGCKVVIDDATARQIAEEKKLHVTSTVALLCDAVRARKLTTVMVEKLADDLLEGEYFLPFGPGGFRGHVLDNGLLDYDEL